MADKATFESELNALMKRDDIETVEQFNAEYAAIVERFIKSGTVNVTVNGQTDAHAAGAPATCAASVPRMPAISSRPLYQAQPPPPMNKVSSVSGTATLSTVPMRRARETRESRCRRCSSAVRVERSGAGAGGGMVEADRSAMEPAKSASARSASRARSKVSSCSAAGSSDASYASEAQSAFGWSAACIASAPVPKPGSKS